MFDLDETAFISRLAAEQISFHGSNNWPEEREASDKKLLCAATQVDLKRAPDYREV